MDVPDYTVPAAVASKATALQIVIARGGDFVIQLTPPTLAQKPLVKKVGNAPPKPLRAVEFLVSRQVMVEHSTFLRDLFRVQPKMPILSIEKKHFDVGYALEVWLRAIHNVANTTTTDLKGLRTERAWVTIAVGEQFGFAPDHTEKIKPWFIELYRFVLNDGPGLTPMIARCLAFPCRVFDHAEGFMKLTKYLVYNTNTTMFTHNPSSFEALGVEARLLDGPLTAARAHVQSVLEQELSFPLDKLHRANCSCRKETAFDYEDALRALDCWPVDRSMRRYPLHEIIEELYKFEFTPKVTHCESGACRHDFKNSVNIAIDKAKICFDGLCIDCMNRSKLVSNQSREDFIEANSPYKGYWDMGCRFGHKRSSWYFSWMGPSSTRTYILDVYHREVRQRSLEDKGNGSRRSGRGRSKQPATTGSDPSPIPDGNLRAGGPVQATANLADDGSDKENSYGAGYDMNDDDEEFFDAEDAYLDGNTAADGELDHDAIN